MGLLKIRLHDTRHWAATLILQNGVPINVVQERLGHFNAMTTLTVHAHAEGAGSGGVRFAGWVIA